MYGDTAVIRALARRMGERAAEIRAEADRLVGHAEAVPWTGLAADAMRHLARDHAAGCAPAPRRTRTAGAALDRHAREVDHLEELIAAVEHRVLHLLHSASSGVAGSSPPRGPRRARPLGPPLRPATARQPRVARRTRAEADVTGPDLVVDVDLAVRRGRTTTRLRARHALRGQTVQAVATDGERVEVSRFEVSDWPARLSRACAVDAPPAGSAPAPDGPCLPWDLVVGTGAALAGDRPDLYDELIARAARCRRAGAPAPRVARPAAASSASCRGGAASAGSPGSCRPTAGAPSRRTSSVDRTARDG